MQLAGFAAFFIGAMFTRTFSAGAITQCDIPFCTNA